MRPRQQDEVLVKRLADANLLDRETLVRALAEADALRAQGGSATLAALLLSRGLVSTTQLHLLGSPGEAATVADDSGPVPGGPRLPTRLRASQTLCGCTVGRELGRGGMGAEWRLNAGRELEPGSTCEADLKRAMALAPESGAVLSAQAYYVFRQSKTSPRKEDLQAEAERIYARDRARAQGPRRLR